MTQRNTDIELLKQDLTYLKRGIDDIKTELKCIKDSKVSRERFDLVNAEQNKRIDRVEKLVFGAIALTLTSIGKAILDFFVGVR